MSESPPAQRHRRLPAWQNGSRIQVDGAVGVMNPEPFLSGVLETRAVLLARRSEGIDALKPQAAAVNRAAIIAWNRFIFGTASVFPASVPAFVVTVAEPYLPQHGFLLRPKRLPHWRAQSAHRAATGNAVYQHMILIEPIKLVSPFVVLIGCGMNAQCAFRVALGTIVLEKLVFNKGTHTATAQGSVKTKLPKSLL